MESNALGYFGLGLLNKKPLPPFTLLNLHYLFEKSNSDIFVVNLKSNVTLLVT